MVGRDTCEVGGEKRGGPAHILLVDDEPHILHLIERALTDDGFRVTRVRRLTDARKTITSDRPDLVVLDVVLPAEDEGAPDHRWNGFDFASELRENPATAAVPVIMLPFRAADDAIFGPTMRRLLAREKRPFVHKPFNPRELIEEVHAVLAMGEAAAPSSQWLGRVGLDEPLV